MHLTGVPFVLVFVPVLFLTNRGRPGHGVGRVSLSVREDVAQAGHIGGHFLLELGQPCRSRDAAPADARGCVKQGK